MNRFEFLGDSYTAKSKVTGEDFLILAIVFLTQYKRMMDRQTDRRTDGHSDDSYNSACIACYANGLSKTFYLQTTMRCLISHWKLDIFIWHLCQITDNFMHFLSKMFHVVKNSSSKFPSIKIKRLYGQVAYTVVCSCIYCSWNSFTRSFDVSGLFINWWL